MTAGGERKTNVWQSIFVLKYVSHGLKIRWCPSEVNFNPVVYAGHLTQELILHYYSRIEGESLKFIHNQQEKVRVGGTETGGPERHFLC